MQTVFPGNLDLPASLTFLTVTLRHPALPSIEPGSFDPATAIELYDHLDEAADLAPPGSTLRADFEARRAYIEESRERMSEHPGKCDFVILDLQKMWLLRHEIELKYPLACLRSATDFGAQMLMWNFQQAAVLLGGQDLSLMTLQR